MLYENWALMSGAVYRARVTVHDNLLACGVLPDHDGYHVTNLPGAVPLQLATSLLHC